MKQKISFILFAFILLTQNSFAALNQAPVIDLPGTDGNVQLESFKGKVVYLDFWASWCEPCKKSFPWMHEMKATYAAQGFEIVAVNLDKDKKLADAFLRAVDVNFKVAFDESGESASRYKLRGMPSSYLIDRDGNVYASHIGFRDKDKSELEQAIKDLLIK
ncbi:MAG: TlpA family protein disulfide reductase [Gammaproteobacteria bacterium]|jgi:thiol-disulfide isomerase/thioredoxin|nr:TlpA family protein disulfide reductase [Gammaproteobacteria bacterium]